MKLYILGLLIFLVLIPFTSCTNSGTYEGRYIIENQTDKRVELRFYSHRDGPNATLALTRNSDGPGVLYDESKKLYSPLDRETPEIVYGADSIVILFDNQHVQTHFGFIPIYNSLTFFGDYKSEGNIKRYVITNQNFEEAIPCDGTCD